jgi:NNP family nitrate/nitrite transporter-like MFS transporter
MGSQAMGTRQGRTLEVWTPEDKAFWEREGEAVAKLNLWISVPALFLAFAIWQVWSVVAVSLPGLGFNYSTNQLFWLAAAPALSGATLRIFYSFMVPLVGGRRWTAISTASLLIPALGIGFAVQDNTTSYTTMLMLALLCGLGGGNFSSSMANISFFFPKERKGSALGVNAGLGNLGVSVVQFLSPLVVTAGIFGIFGGDAQTVTKAGVQVQVWTQNAAFIWVPWIALSRAGGLVWHERPGRGQGEFCRPGGDLPPQAQLADVCAVPGHLRQLHRLRGRVSAAHQEPVPGVNPLAYAWLGPLVGALVRPFGGWLADKLGGARVTLWNFVVMACAVGGVLAFLPNSANGGTGGNFTGFFLSFLVLFLTTGIGNGSTFRMIPVIFLNQKLQGVDRNDRDALQQCHQGRQHRGRRHAGLFGGHGGLRRLFHPQELRHFDLAHRQPRSGAVRLHRFYLRVHRGDVVALQPQERPHALLNPDHRP